MNENQRLANVQNRTHLSIRQLAVFVLSLLMVGVMVFTNQREEVVADSEIVPVPVLSFFSTPNSIISESSCWYCLSNLFI